jgi:transposase
MEQITTVAVDLAKDVLVVCAANQAGREIFVRQFDRKGFAEWSARLPACAFGMEACGSAHDWARRLSAHGHAAQLMSPEFVKAFTKNKGAKNDRNDARAILTAMRQPDMRFVAVKSIDQQTILAWHRMREGWIRERTGLINRVRGLLAEFGIWLKRSRRAVMEALPRLAQEHGQLPAPLGPLLQAIHEQLRSLDDQIERCELEIKDHARQDEAARRVAQISGVGPITSSALVASVTNARDFKNGRQLAAWVGLTPSQHSSGGVQRLGAITKRGDPYLRKLLTEGAHSALQAAMRKAPQRLSRLERWMVELNLRAGYHKTVVAIANKNMRMAWAILATGEHYDAHAWQRRLAA